MTSQKAKLITQTSPYLLRKNQSPKKSLPHQLKSKSNPFLSKASRFHYKHSQIPGPGTYQSPLKQRHTSDYQVIQQQAGTGICKEHMWIVSKGRQLFETNNQWKVNLGPGKYLQNKRLKPDGSSGWSKNTRFNYDKVEKKTNLGPTSYALGANFINKKSIAGSAFKSKSTKSHIDDLVKDQVKLHQSRLNPEFQIRDINEEISQQKDEQNQEVKVSPKKDHGSPVFLSKIERLPKIQSQKVGPGSYTIEPLLRIQRKRRVNTDTRTSSCREELIIQKHNSSKVVSPGPGSYQLDKKGQGSSKIVKKPTLGLIMKQGRFKSSTLSDRNICKQKYMITAQRVEKSEQANMSAKMKTVPDIKNIYNILKRIQKQKDSQQHMLTIEPIREAK